MLKANRDKGYSLKNSDFNLPRFNKIKYGMHSLRYYGSFLQSKRTKELRAEDRLRRFKTKISPDHDCLNRGWLQKLHAL